MQSQPKDGDYLCINHCKISNYRKYFHPWLHNKPKKKKTTIKDRNWKSKKRSDGSACCRIIKLWYIQTCMDNNHHASFAYFLYPKTKQKSDFFWWVCWGIRKRVCQSPWSIKYRDACKTGATTNIIIFPLFMFLQKNTHKQWPQIGKA